MELKDETIDKLANLAKLSFEGADKESIKGDLENILDFMNQLNEIDTEGVEPLIFMSEEINILREDTPSDSLTHEEILRNAPQKDSDYIRIPKVLNKNADHENN